MNAIAIIGIVSEVLKLSTKYIEIAQQAEELSAEQEAAFKAELTQLMSQDHWKVETDPAS